MCAAAADSLHAYLAKGLLQAVVIAMQRVLLDGGPNRCALLRRHKSDGGPPGGFAVCCRWRAHTLLATSQGLLQAVCATGRSACVRAWSA